MHETAERNATSAPVKSDIAPAKPVKLLDQVRNRICVKHYSRSTEKTYIYWIKLLSLLCLPISPSGLLILKRFMRHVPPFAAPFSLRNGAKTGQCFLCMKQNQGRILPRKSYAVAEAIRHQNRRHDPLVAIIPRCRRFCDPPITSPSPERKPPC